MPTYSITIAGHPAQVVADLSWRLTVDLERDLLDSGVPDFTVLGYKPIVVAFQCKSASAIAFEAFATAIKAIIILKTPILVAGWPLDQASYNGIYYVADLSRGEGFGCVDFTITLEKV